MLDINIQMTVLSYPICVFHMFQYSIHHYTYIINLYLYLYQKYTFKVKGLIQMLRWNPRSCQRPCSGRCIARIGLLGLGCRWRDFCFKKLSVLSYICWEPGYVKVYKATSGSSQATWSLHYICFQRFVWQLTWEIQKNTRTFANKRNPIVDCEQASKSWWCEAENISQRPLKRYV